MEYQDIMRQTPTNRIGYVPQSISKSGLHVKDLDIYKKLNTVPGKITAYFHRDKIKEVYKSDCFSRLENYYLIRASDDTIFHINF